MNSIKKKALAAALACGLGFTTLTVSASPALAASCRAEADDSRKFIRNGDGDGTNDPLVVTWVYYNYCTTPDPGGQRWAKVTHVQTTVNVPGGSTNCQDGKWQDGAYFNWYFWRPYNGTNFNPGQYHVPCDPSTYFSKTKVYTDHPDNVRLYFGPELNRPRWKWNVRLTRKWDFDLEDTYGTHFRPND